MKLVKISSTFTFGKINSGEKGACCPKPKANAGTSYCGVIIVENPKTQAALRTACRIIAADMYEKSRKN